MKLFRAHSEKGDTTIIIAGALGMLMVFLTLLYVAVNYYFATRDTYSAAWEIANYSVNYLPNHQLACERAFDGFHAFSKNLLNGRDRFAEGAPSMSIFIDSVSYNAGTGASTVVRAGPYTQASDCAVALPPPIESITVKLSRDVSFDILDFAGLKGAAGTNFTFTVNAEATAKLATTDVVLVIENSGSVVSPIAGESSTWTDDLPAEYPFDLWSEDKAGRMNGDEDHLYRPADEDSIALKELPKSLQYARRCFGEVHYDIKKGALKLFDLLTSSSSFRVGIVHTDNMSSAVFAPTIEISSDSYARSYVAESVLNNPAGSSDPEIARYRTSPDPSYGALDNPESRCAAITSNSEDAPAYYFPEPDHPFKDKFSGVTWSEPEDMVNLSSETARTRVTFADPLSFFPRDLVWIANAGRAGELSKIDLRSDLTLVQLAVVRAFDMLGKARERADHAHVQNRAVIVITDGFENPVTLGADPASVFPEGLGLVGNFKRMAENHFADGDTLTEETYRVIQPSETPAATDRPLLSSYCADSDLNDYSVGQNLIYENSKVGQSSADENENGIKLGVLYFSKRATYADLPNDPMSTRASPPGHDIGSSEDLHQINRARTYCNTPWTYSRGRFMMEAGNVSDLTDSLVPLTARLLFKRASSE